MMVGYQWAMVSLVGKRLFHPIYSLQVDKRLMEKLDWVQKLMQDLAPVEQ